MNPCALDEPEGRSLNIMHVRSVNKVLKLFINLASESGHLDLRGFTPCSYLRFWTGDCPLKSQTQVVFIVTDHLYDW